MLVFDRVEMSVIEMANPRGHRDVPTLHGLYGGRDRVPFRGTLHDGKLRSAEV